MRLGSSSRSAIGVDVGSRTIKAVQLARDGRLAALSLLPRPRAETDVSAEDAQALKAVLGRQGFRGDRLVVAAPDKTVLPAALELPAKVGGAAAEQVVRLELSRLHNLRPDSFEMAYWDLKSPDSLRAITHALAVACPHEAADGLLDVFEDAGFHVAALDVRGAAAARACAPLGLEPPQLSAILDLGWRSTSLLLVCGSSLVYARPLDAPPMADLTAKLAETFEIPAESASQIPATIGPTAQQPTGHFDRASLEAVCKHLRAHFDRLLDGLKTPLSYAKHQFPGDGIKRMLLIGGGAAVPDLAPYFAQRLGFDVRRADPAALAESPAPLLTKASHPAMTVALGLALFDGGS